MEAEQKERQDRRVLKTREAIERAYFLKLAQNKKKITVTEIARDANIDRKTFYLHYNSIEDIAKDFLDARVRELLDALPESGFYEDPVQIRILFETLNHIIEREFTAFRQLALDQYHHYFWEEIHEIMVRSLFHTYGGKVTVDKEDFQIYCDFCVSGLIHIYQNYLKDPQKVSPDRMGKVMLDIVMHGFVNLFRNINDERSFL